MRTINTYKYINNGWGNSAGSTHLQHHRNSEIPVSKTVLFSMSGVRQIQQTDVRFAHDRLSRALSTIPLLRLLVLYTFEMC